MTEITGKRITESNKERILRCIKEIIPSTLKTCIWLVKITAGVSLVIFFLKYLKILPWFSQFISPVFNHLGLPGEAALPYVTGFFVNVYAAISVAVAFDFNVRALTILSVMILCSHNMVTETAVQKKTGSSAIRMLIIRTLSAFVIAFVLNKLLPGAMAGVLQGADAEELSFTDMFKDWAVSTGWVVVKMTVLIFSLAIFQKILSEYGIIRWISKFFRPLLAVFGLPAKTSFLWIVANTLGLAYGAAVMMEETRSGKIDKRDIDLLNTHISISHSNLEDLILLSAIGGVWYVLLLSRWVASFVLVWELRLEYLIKDKFIRKNY